MNTIKKYPKTMIIIHWLTFALLIFVFIRGKALEGVEFKAINVGIFRAHAIPGMLILILTLIRYFIKRKNKNNVPKEIEYYSAGHKLIVNTVSKLIYVLLVVTPLIGFIMIFKTGALAYDFGGAFPEGAELNETLEVLHKIFVFSLVGMIVLHVSGVVIYKVKTGENLLKRMCMLIK